MSDKIPDGITEEHIHAAIMDFDRGLAHAFGSSTGYDVLYKGRRYPPKAIIGLAAAKIIGEPLGPYDFKGGLQSKCFRILEREGFSVVSKGDVSPFPDEPGNAEKCVEGCVERVAVNRYERDPVAREKSIGHYGPRCQVCGFDFEVEYGALGQGFIHVHHLVPLSQVGVSYEVDPISDLRPVCPNCHAMLHKRVPPYAIEELREIIRAVRG